MDEETKLQIQQVRLQNGILKTCFVDCVNRFDNQQLAGYEAACMKKCFNRHMLTIDAMQIANDRHDQQMRGHGHL